MARDDYIEVKDRLATFLEKYPEGSMSGEWRFVDRLGEQWIAYRAEAYRTPTDPRPGVGWAWEPLPGRTPFTKDSELMVAETSAWGRALAAIGIAVHKGIASGDEVRAAENRRATPNEPGQAQRSENYKTANHTTTPITEPQLKKLRYEMKRAGADEIILDAYSTDQLGFGMPLEGLDHLTKGQAMQLIDALTKQIIPNRIVRTTTSSENDPWTH